MAVNSNYFNTVMRKRKLPIAGKRGFMNKDTKTYRKHSLEALNVYDIEPCLYGARTENLAKHVGREVAFIPAGISGWSFPVLYRVPVLSEHPQTRPSEGQGFHL